MSEQEGLMKVALIVSAAAALTLAGCDHDGWRKHHADPAKITADIKAREAQWQKAYADKDVDALAAQYSDDAAVAGPGDPLATTAADRRKLLQSMTSDPNFALTFSSDRILVAKAGDLASSRGHFSLTMTDKATNKPGTITGTYL